MDGDSNMTYTPYTWSDADDITAARLNNIEGQYTAAKADFGAITVTVTVAIDGTSIHGIGADHLIPIGATNAETTINTAIDEAVAAGGGEVLLLEGTYVIGGPIKLKDKITLSGMGGNTIIKIKNGVNANINAITHNTVAAPGNKNMVVKDLVVDGNNSNQVAGTQLGIAFYNCTDTSARNIIRNCYVKYTRSSGIYVEGSKAFIVDKCVAFGCGGGAGINASGSTVQFTNNTATGNGNGMLLTGCSDCVIANTDGFGNSYYGIDLSTATVRTAVTGCTLYNNAYGLRVVGATYNSILGNTFRNNSGYGITLEASAHYTTIVGNSMYQNGMNLIIANSNYATVSGNTCSYSTGNAGIYLGTASYCTVSNNVIYRNHEAGITLTGSNRNVIESNNVSANAQGHSGPNIILANSSSDNTIIGNRCHKGGGPIYPNYGISIVGASCASNLVTANNLKEGGSAGTINNSGTGTDTTAWLTAGNKIA
jgi:parallel beta-helix repeat protein